MQRVNVNSKWMPITVGVLDIIAGAFQLLATTWASLYSIIAWHAVEGVFIMDAIFGFTGILAIVGGVYALRRKKWGLALAGSFTAFFPNLLWPLLLFNIRISELPFTPWALFALLGIAAIVLTVLSRKEFK